MAVDSRLQNNGITAVWVRQVQYPAQIEGAGRVCVKIRPLAISNGGIGIRAVFGSGHEM